MRLGGDPAVQRFIQLANQRDPKGRALPHSIRLQINKELPVSFRLPNKVPVTEQMVYNVLYNFLNALMNTGVGVCGGKVVRPLAGRTEPRGSPRDRDRNDRDRQKVGCDC